MYSKVYPFQNKLLQHLSIQSVDTRLWYSNPSGFHILSPKLCYTKLTFSMTLTSHKSFTLWESYFMFQCTRISASLCISWLIILIKWGLFKNHKKQHTYISIAPQFPSSFYLLFHLLFLIAAVCKWQFVLLIHMCIYSISVKTIFPFLPKNLWFLPSPPPITSCHPVCPHTI